MKNKKGFTLVELLAVIVIFSILSTIAVVGVSKSLDNSKKKLLVSSSKNLASAGEAYYIANGGDGTIEVDCSDIAEVNDIDYESCVVKIRKKKAEVTIHGKGKFEGMVICRGTKQESVVTNSCTTPSGCFQIDDSSSSRIRSYYDYEYNDSSNDACPRDVIIPSEINGTKITSIFAWAFKKKGITSVKIPNTITQIGKDSFRNNKISRLDLPSSVVNIGMGAFNGNDITKLVLPNKLKYIGDAAFANNEIENLVIPSSVTQIETAAFNNNRLPDSQAFIYARKSDGSIDKTKIVSYGGINRDNIVIPDGVQTFSGNVQGNGSFAFNSITSITIPNSVISIASNAFANNKLTSVTIPSSVKSIGAQAFSYNDLVTVNLNEGLETMSSWVFSNNEISEIVIPSTVTSMNYGVLQYNKNLTKVVNKTGRGFDWCNIINGSGSTCEPYITGELGNVIIASE